jgi:hypothetical protein
MNKHRRKLYKYSDLKPQAQLRARTEYQDGLIELNDGPRGPAEEYITIPKLSHCHDLCLDSDESLYYIDGALAQTLD